MLKRAFAPILLAWQRLDPAWQAALPAWLAGRLGLSLWAGWIWLQQLMPDTGGEFYREVTPLLQGWQGALLGMWQRWDSIYYQMLAEQFYTSAKTSVFFPAYPVLGRVVMQLTGLSSVAALLLVSSLAALFCLVLLFRTTRDLFPADPAAAGLAVQRAVLFPTAFFLFAIYPQSLALLWMLLAYRQAQRGRWLAAGLAGLLAGLTHATVISLAAMLALQVIPALRAQRGWLRRLALLCVPGLPLLGVGLFLVWREWMGFPGMAEMQIADWQRFISYPLSTLWVLISGFPGNYLGNWVLFVNSALLALSVGVIIWGLRRLPAALSVYQAGLVLFTLSSGLAIDPLLSFDRFILAAFPIYMALALFARGRRGRVIYFALSLLASLGLSAMFFMWKWIG